MKKHSFSFLLFIYFLISLCFVNNHVSMLFEYCLKTKWFKKVTITLKELALEFDPVKPKCMQECFEKIHAHQNSKSAEHVNIKPDKRCVAILRKNSLSNSQIEKDLS